MDEYRRLGDKILVLPGFEFTATFGFHILAIFPPETPLRKLELLLLRLNVPVDRLDEGSTEVGATTDVLTAYRLIDEAGGLVIAAHANSTHGVALQGLSFGGQTKIAFTQDPHLHALEVTDLESSSRRADGALLRRLQAGVSRAGCTASRAPMRTGWCRDPKDKNRLGIGDRVTEVLLPEVSFEALKAVFEATTSRARGPIGPPPRCRSTHVEAAREQGNTIVQSFHESMTREGGRLHKVLCDVVAFANTSGGTVYIGVSATRKTASRGRRERRRRSGVPEEGAGAQHHPAARCAGGRRAKPGRAHRAGHGAQRVRQAVRVDQTQIYVRQEGETSEAVRDEIVQLVLGGRQAAAIAEVEQNVRPGCPPRPRNWSSSASRTFNRPSYPDDRSAAAFHRGRDHRRRGAPGRSLLHHP